MRHGQLFIRWQRSGLNQLIDQNSCQIWWHRRLELLLHYRYAVFLSKILIGNQHFTLLVRYSIPFNSAQFNFFLIALDNHSHSEFNSWQPNNLTLSFEFNNRFLLVFCFNQKLTSKIIDKFFWHFHFSNPIFISNRFRESIIYGVWRDMYVSIIFLLSEKIFDLCQNN